MASAIASSSNSKSLGFTKQNTLYSDEPTWLMGVERPDEGHRYEEMVEAAKNYLLTLEEAAKAPADKLAEYEEKLAAHMAPYADNPAFQAFLELKHAAKLGT